MKESRKTGLMIYLEIEQARQEAKEVKEALDGLENKESKAYKILTAELDKRLKMATELERQSYVAPDKVKDFYNRPISTFGADTRSLPEFNNRIRE